MRRKGTVRSPAWTLILRAAGPPAFPFLGSHWDTHLPDNSPKHENEGREGPVNE